MAAGSPRFLSCQVSCAMAVRLTKPWPKQKCWRFELSRSGLSTVKPSLLISGFPFPWQHEPMAFHQGKTSACCLAGNWLEPKTANRLAPNAGAGRLARFRFCISRKRRDWPPYARPDRQAYWPFSSRSIADQFVPWTRNQCSVKARKFPVPIH